ncbi:aquaporin [Streptomyces sp900116325]|uniref:Aquaporin n=1 Tax=Streptomyces sp. 900116325 TaxID=3154295 RepID=A0ABV2UMM5_9ACTN
MSTVSSPSPPPRLARAADEFALTTVLLFVAVTVVRWLRDPDSALYVGDLDAALAVIGILSGAILTGLILSPAGRRSGGHLNPAVTVSLWLMGAFPGRNVVPYVLAQLAGSAAGTGLGRLVWGLAASLPSVDYAAIVPAPAWQPTSVFVAEAGSMTIIIVAVGFTMAHARHARLVPYVIGLSVALVIAVLGPRSGGSINPARQFGPAALAGQSTDLWIYLVAPVLGAVLGAWLYHLLIRRRPLTRTLREVAPGHAVTAEPPADRPRRARHTTALHPGERHPDLQGRHHPSTAAGPQADGGGTRGGDRIPG